MAKLIGTAGHVDHGKTTLIQALTGIDADRLPEEKRRGMTIDIGFAYIDLPEVGRVSIVDVPGHEKFITNMLVGALGIDVALLCVSADEAVMPQTREHLQILELLPVDKLVVAMTRADLADQDTRDLARMDIEELVAGSRFGEAPVVAVSAHTGEGLEALRTTLSEALSGEDDVSKGPWYLPIDRVFAVKGHGCVVTGTLAQGKMAVGDKAIIQPGDIEVRVRSIHSHGEQTESGEKGRRTAVNLSGVKVEDVRRGQALGAPGALFETQIFDAKVRWVGERKHGLRVRVSVGSEEAIGKTFLSDPEPDVVQVRLETPIACALNQPVIIRRYSPPDLLAGGRIAVPQARPRRKSETVSLAGEAVGDEEAILHVLGDNPNGVTTEEVCRSLGKTPQDLGTPFEALDYTPAIDITFGEFLRALITADRDLVPDDDRNYRTAFIEAFRSWGIYPRHVRVLSEESLAWHTPDEIYLLDAKQGLLGCETEVNKGMDQIYDLRQTLLGWKPGTDRSKVFNEVHAVQAVLQRHLKELLDNAAHDEGQFKQLRKLLVQAFDLKIAKTEKLRGLSVANLRPARRVGPNGEFLTEMVFEVVRTAELHEDRKDPSSPLYEFRGSISFVVRLEDWRIRYVIYKRLDSETRQQRQLEYDRRNQQGTFASAEYLCTPYAGNLDIDRAINLEAMRASSCACRGKPKKKHGMNEPFAMLHRSGEEN